MFTNTAQRNKAQAAIEYLLLFGAVVAIVLIGMRKYLPRTTTAAEVYYNKVMDGTLDGVPTCGNNVREGFETSDSCCIDFDSCTSVGDIPGL